MRAAERGLLMLCCHLGDRTADILSLTQLHELSKRARAVGLGYEDASRTLTEQDLTRLGYPPSQAARIVRLLGRELLLDNYLSASEKAGVQVITRLDARFPSRLREKLGINCPTFLFCRGDTTLLQKRCISVIGSRQIAEPGLGFALRAGELIAQEGFVLCSGGAQGADRAAHEACMKAGGRAIIFPATEIVLHPEKKNVLYVAEDGFEIGFSAQRALKRNRLIHAMGEKTLVAQTGSFKGGTWNGTVDNLRHGWSPVFICDNKSAGARALIARGAEPTDLSSGLAALTPRQQTFF